MARGDCGFGEGESVAATTDAEVEAVTEPCGCG